SELIDARGQKVEMLSLLLRVLSKLLFHRLAGEPGRAHRVELVAEDAHDLRGHRVVEEGDGVLHLASIVLRDGAFAQMLPRTATNLLDVGKKRSRSTHVFSSPVDSRRLRDS